MTTVDVQQLHESAVVADTHNDLLMAVVARGPDRWAGYFRDNWLPQLRDGGVDVQVLPVFIDDDYRPEGALRQTLRMIEAAHRIAEANADEVALCLDGAAARRGARLRPHRSRARAGELSRHRCRRRTVGDDAPPRDQDRLADPLRSHRPRRRQRRGRHGRATDPGRRGRPRRDGAPGHPLRRLPPRGRPAWTTCSSSPRRPVIATHSSARAVRDHHRNLADSHLKEIAAGGGVVCVNFFAGFLDETEHTVDRLVDHVEHVAAVAGIDHVGIGPRLPQGDRGPGVAGVARRLRHRRDRRARLHPRAGGATRAAVGDGRTAAPRFRQRTTSRRCSAATSCACSVPSSDGPPSSRRLRPLGAFGACPIAARLAGASLGRH